MAISSEQLDRIDNVVKNFKAGVLGSGQTKTVATKLLEECDPQELVASLLWEIHQMARRNLAMACPMAIRPDRRTHLF